MNKPIISLSTCLLLASATLLLTACNRQMNPAAGKGPGTPHNSLSKQEMKAGWSLLFNGSSFAGWHRYGGAGVGKAWIIQDSCIHLDARPIKNEWQSGEGGDIVTDASFTDFHLKYDWKIAPGGNSGLIFYVLEDRNRYQWGWQSGPEMQVLDNAAHPDAKITKHRAGDLYDLIASRSEPVRPAMEWNHAEIISTKGNLQLYLNGTRVVATLLWTDEWKRLIAESKFKDIPGFGTHRSGKISLQDHGDKVWFRNIKIRRL